MFVPTSTTALNSAYAGAMTDPCYVELFLAGTAQPNLMSGELNVTIIVEQDLGVSPYYLHVAACSYHVPYSAGYFSEFHYPLRKMYPNYTGILINFSGVYPETLQVNIPFTFNSSWWHFDSTDIYFAVWLQSHTASDKQVHQSENMDISSLNSVEETPLPLNPSDLFALGNPYPNPFSTVAFIPVFIENPAFLSVTVFDLTGRAVRDLFSGTSLEENCVFSWDGKNDYGNELTAGIYRIELSCEGVKDSRTIIKIR